MDQDAANKKVHAVFSKSQAKFVPDDHKFDGESPELTKPYTFHILSLDTADQGTFKQKSYNRTHLSEMYELFDDVHKIRKQDAHMILIGNGKLIKHTSNG